MTPNAIISSLILEDETLRDGLQSESRLFEIEEKIAIITMLEEAGLRRIQVGSFVHPKLVPQMSNTDELVRRLGTTGTLITGLILNTRGLERALNCGVRHVSMGVSASNTHSLKNVNLSAEEALSSMTALISEAKQAGLKVRAGVQCAFGCVYEGPIPQEKVLAAAERMAKAGADEINLADTTGMGTPVQIRTLVRQIQKSLHHLSLSLHLHDTRGLGLANMWAGYEEGVRIFDVCAGGLGGCPFVKGAAGNVPLEDAVNMFHSMGVKTGIDLEKCCAVVEYLENLLGRPLPGHMNRVLKGMKSYGPS